MSGARDTVTVRVPGSTSNCSAGFDTLGLALSVYNRVTLTRLAGDAGARPATESDRRAVGLVTAAAEGWARATGRAAGPFRFHIVGDVPPARGLGSSATIITGVLAGLDALHGTGCSRSQLAALGTAIEGNPDNISPSLFGGFTVSRCDPATGAYLDTIRFAVLEDLAFVVASPAVELLTKESRGARRAAEDGPVCRRGEEREQRGLPHGGVCHGGLRKAAPRRGRLFARAVPSAEDPRGAGRARGRGRGRGAVRLAEWEWVECAERREARAGRG